MTDTGNVAAWDEPAGGTPRGTLVVLPGRGETAASYERFGRRLGADAYKVRVVPVSLDDVTEVADTVGKLLADESLPSPKVLVGSDSGATLAAALAAELPVDAVVLAGIALPDSAAVGSWEDEVAARTACPVHTRVIGEDDGFRRGALNEPLPWSSFDPTPLDKPVLVLHGAADRVTPATSVLGLFPPSDSVTVRLVEGGRHDVLNDATHRSVAATLVLFLESLRLGPGLPAVVVAAS
jgi:alpha-beta hydrolase superfamily lysophospholipase